MLAEKAETSEDAVLGGRLVLRQPLRGHRVGHDAILLAAAAVAASGDHAVDLGSGVGGAGLAMARRIQGLNVTLVEIDPALAALAAGNAQRNGLSDRVRAVHLDVVSSTADFIAAGLAPGSAACVLMNPPFNVAQQPSPDRARRTAHAATDETLQQWLRPAMRLLRGDGVVTLIWRADGLADVLAALNKDFGAITVLPVHPKPGAAAIRVLVRATKASRAPLALLPGFLLADADGKPTAAAEAVLRKGEALSLTGN
ncbi:MAG TPA: methyltransferase [Xanthobacteraceae bacterium]|jgi:tRNA1(Val) A37 N6-methylase TrmN6|nr:methyltransferase [Xanthobacteraceae bacterium]